MNFKVMHKKKKFFTLGNKTCMELTIEIPEKFINCKKYVGKLKKSY